MSVATVGAALAEIQEAITGIQKAYAHDEIPPKLNTSDLPAILNFPMAAEYTIYSHSFVQVVREWQMQLYIAPFGRDPDPGRVGGELEPFFRRVYLEFLDNIQLNSLTDVKCAMLTRDTGWSVLAWGGVEYIGTEFIIEVNEKFVVTEFGP